MSPKRRPKLELKDVYVEKAKAWLASADVDEGAMTSAERSAYLQGFRDAGVPAASLRRVNDLFWSISR